MAHNEKIHYPKAPLVEAIFEIEAPIEVVGDAKEFFDRTLQFVDIEELESKKEIRQEGFRFDQKKDQRLVGSQIDSTLLGVSFGSDEKVVQFRRNGMSFHKLQPYGSYEEVIPEFRKYWEGFQEFGPKATIRQNLRFVNKIILPNTVIISDIDKFAKVSPSFALEGELAPISLFSRVQLEDPETGNNASVTFAINHPKSPIELIFDITVSSSKKYTPTDPELWNSFEELRNFKNRLFKESLHEDCLRLFK